nr:protein FORGETTER 1-like isoform X4 [Nicotiana tomentosiformis]
MWPSRQTKVPTLQITFMMELDLQLEIPKTLRKTESTCARQSHQRIRIVRIVTTTDNQRIVGLLIPDAAVEPVLQAEISIGT